MARRLPGGMLDGDAAGDHEWIGKESTRTNLRRVTIAADLCPLAACITINIYFPRAGIGIDGMLVVRGIEGVPLRDRARIRRLVDAENRDRKQLYQEIAKANDFGSDRVGDIQRIFAETWTAKAERGWWLQKSGGSWAEK